MLASPRDTFPRFAIRIDDTRQLLASLMTIAAVMALAASVSAACLTSPRDTRPPNVIVIMTDDQGYGDIGFHGNEMISTPALDQLAGESFRLTNFHVDPTCSETRAALMTGRYATRTGVWHTVMGRSILRRDEMTMAEVFRANGYATGHFGKWHLGDNPPYRPEDRGFVEVVRHGGGGVGQTPDAWGNDYFDDRYWRNGKLTSFEGYCTDVFFGEATAFVRAHRDQPFFCYIATNAPHGPYLVEDRYVAPYREEGVPHTMARFYGMITNLDENLGRLRATLRELEIDDNTLLIFLTDNGTAAGVARRSSNAEGWSGFNAGMRGQKGSPYDGGHRVPCFWHWPAGDLTGRSSDRLTAHLDILPTLVDLCDLKLPLNTQFDGASLVDLLRPNSSPADPDLETRILCVHSQRVDHPVKGRRCAVMQGPWRWVNRSELYNVQTDPGQQQDVSQAHPERVQQLDQAYEAWWSDVTRRADEYVAIDIGAEEGTSTWLTAHDWHAPINQIPWNQASIRRDPAVNGTWYVSVRKPGHYRFTLRTRPPGVESQLSPAAGTARVEIQNQVREAEFSAAQEAISLEVPLVIGQTTLRTSLTLPDEKSRGAYYVGIERLPSGLDARTEPLFQQGDRVALVGGAFVERMQLHNFFESYVLTARPDLQLTFRNLGWSGDDLKGTARAVFGTPEDGYERRLRDLQKADPSVVVLCYGGNAAFAGPAGLDAFLDDYKRLLDDLAKRNYRIILCSPHRLEYAGAPLPKPEQANAQRQLYGQAIQTLANERQLPFVDLFELLPEQRFQADGRPIIRDRLTEQGLHLTKYGYWRVAPVLAARFGIVHEPAEITVDLRDEVETDAVGGEIRELRADERQVAFEWLPGQQPFVGPPAQHPRGGRMTAGHDRFRFVGLAPGRYGLNFNGQPTLLADHEQWEQGVFVVSGAFLEQSDQLLQALQQKNEAFFHYHRPQNETYLFLFRKHEQGNNAGEVNEFLPLVEAAEAEIKRLSQPQPIQVELVRVED